MKWNVATDLAINSHIADMLPEGGCIPSKVGTPFEKYPLGLSAEAYLKLIEEDEQFKNEDGEGGQGGQGGVTNAFSYLGISEDDWKLWNQYAESATDPSTGAIAAGVDFLNKLLGDRTGIHALNGNGMTDLNTIDQIIREGYINGLHNFDAEVFLKLAIALNAVGDSNTANKQKAETLLSALFSTNHLSISDLFSNGQLEYQGDGLNPANGDTTATYSSILDKILGTGRGKFNRKTSSRADDLDKKTDADGRDLVKDLSGLNDRVETRVIAGLNVEIKGTFKDSGKSPKPKGVDVLVIASGRDTIIKDDLTIQNDEHATTDAYVIAAADELYLRDPWNQTTHAQSYVNPDHLNIRVENASLALASVDEMNLVNVNISTGGSLALASLDDISIWSTKSTDNIFDIGNGVRQEGLYMYAEGTLSISDTQIKGHLDDVYLEATTITLDDVTFSKNAAVLFRSQSGRLNILNDGGTFGVGDVNFNNVKHLGIKADALTRSDFNFGGENIGAKSKKSSSSNRPYIEVQKIGN